MIINKALRITTVLSILLLLVIGAFAQVDVPRKTKAITYPLDEDITVSFRGTTRFPRMKGNAKIKRTKKNGTEIKLSVSKMPRPFELGTGYATYVLWAISPTGQVDNLGEIKRRGFFEFDSKISVTTPLQTFALIITAEPHFLVSRPSQEIMLENLRPSSRSGRSIATTTSISYFGNSSDYFRDARTPQIAEVNYRRTPISILQAKQAIALAKFAGADRDAPDDLREAQTLLNNAENGWKAGRGEEYVDIAARKAISTAVRAENTSNARKEAREKRNLKMRRDAELRTAEDKYDAAQREIAELKAALSGETRSLELSERDKENYLAQIKSLKDENDRLRREAEEARIKLAKFEAKQQLIEEQKAKIQRAENMKTATANLMNALRSYGSVSQTDRGIVLTLSENYWSGVRVSSFSEDGDTKLNNLAGTIANAGNYKIFVESHVDSKGTPEALKLLTEERAQAVSDKMISKGIDQDKIEAKGFGPDLPVVDNSTWANRDKNRRVQIILVPNS
ncbi:MAG: OmpA family protein [Pyrinomonadaceae bacterium]|nr:OmpA family protein [Pyrinomonadaceae bacterium]